jgi:hypothetical protein
MVSICPRLTVERRRLFNDEAAGDFFVFNP